MKIFSILFRIVVFVHSNFSYGREEVGMKTILSWQHRYIKRIVSVFEKANN